MTPPDNGQTSPSLQERVAKLEATLRERAVAERIDNLEYQLQEDDDAASDDTGQPSNEGEGKKALFLALANFLNSGAVKDVFGSVGDLLKQHSDNKSKEAETQAKEAQAQRSLAWKSTRLGLGFSALVLILLCVLVWFDKITKDLAAGLIGSLIGYWYGHQKDR